ncbi:MAG: helix-turn-helix domain-containing protein [Gammaproteobacteria bacterium]|nr:helix-turn-helix domain-containing protein [Gammaproteobacteria bacterium]
MTESDNSEAEIHEPAAFGQQLMLAREKAGMTLEEAARALNLKQEIVEAIEDSALDRLPPVTFVQGYVRSYAKLLGLPEENILREFEEEVPHERESELQPRPPSPDGANSQSPLIKLTTGLIIVIALVVLLYALYSYLSERTEHIEQASHADSENTVTGLAPEAPDMAPEADIVEEEILSVEVEPLPEPKPDVDEETPAESVAEPVVPATEPLPEIEVADEVVEAISDEKPTVAVEEIMPVVEPKPITGGDEMNLSAEEESWAEIVDANEIRLFYGMIRPGRTLNLVGQAPFDVFLGNAPAVSLSMNSIAIDMTKYIRSNNIAQFKISVEEGRVRFH